MSRYLDDLLLSGFRNLAGNDEYDGSGALTQAAINKLQEAVAILNSSDEFGNAMESANHHSIGEVLDEFARGLHAHIWRGYRHSYSDGSYEVECSVPGCWNVKFYESDG